MFSKKKKCQISSNLCLFTYDNNQTETLIRNVFKIIHKVGNQQYIIQQIIKVLILMPFSYLEELSFKTTSIPSAFLDPKSANILSLIILPKRDSPAFNIPEKELI